MCRSWQWFVYYDDVTALTAVLEAGGDLSSLNVNEELGNAAFFGHWKMSDFLIARGADVNASVAETGETPLHRAAAYADEPTIEFLLAHGADREARDENGDSPLRWASDHGAGWGTGMERKLVGDYLPESLRKS